MNGKVTKTPDPTGIPTAWSRHQQAYTAGFHVGWEQKEPLPPPGEYARGQAFEAYCAGYGAGYETRLRHEQAIVEDNG